MLKLRKWSYLPKQQQNFFFEIALTFIFLDALARRTPLCSDLWGAFLVHLLDVCNLTKCRLKYLSPGGERPAREGVNETERNIPFIAGSSINTILFISAVHDSITIQIPASPLHLNNKTTEADNVHVAHRWGICAMDKVKQTFESHREDSNRLLNIAGSLVITLFILYLWREQAVAAVLLWSRPTISCLIAWCYALAMHFCCFQDCLTSSSLPTHHASSILFDLSLMRSFPPFTFRFPLLSHSLLIPWARIE